MSTPLRRWIRKTLIESVSMGTIWSDTNPGAFYTLTGLKQTDLNKRWFETTGEGDNVKVTNWDGKGTDPTFTTCSSFLPRFATKIRQAGNLPTTKFNNFTGKNQDINLRGFQLHTERGWTPAFLGYAVNGGPKEGDFFQLGHGGMTDHVGIIVKIKGELWGKVAGGAGGRGSKHDGVKRTPLEPTMGVMGWLDVDVYFEGWAGADPGDISDDYA
jgi:hypothetical protein